MSLNMFDINGEDLNGRKCNQYFRYRESKYISSGRSIVTKTSLDYLKRMSCNGTCSNCRCFSPLIEANEDGLENMRIEWPAKHPQDGHIYLAEFVPDYVNEMGYCEEWHWYMNQV